jgi:hypothetical protein
LRQNRSARDTSRCPAPADVLVRILQRILALTAATWHNDHTGHPVKQSLLACDH